MEFCPSPSPNICMVLSFWKWWISEWFRRFFLQEKLTNVSTKGGEGQNCSFFDNLYGRRLISSTSPHSYIKDAFNVQLKVKTEKKEKNIHKQLQDKRQSSKHNAWKTKEKSCKCIKTRKATKSGSWLEENDSRRYMGMNNISLLFSFKLFNNFFHLILLEFFRFKRKGIKLQWKSIELI